MSQYLPVFTMSDGSFLIPTLGTADFTDSGFTYTNQGAILVSSVEGTDGSFHANLIAITNDEMTVGYAQGLDASLHYTPGSGDSPYMDLIVEVKADLVSAGFDIAKVSCYNLADDDAIDWGSYEMNYAPVESSLILANWPL